MLKKPALSGVERSARGVLPSLRFLRRSRYILFSSLQGELAESANGFSKISGIVFQQRAFCKSLILPHVCYT
jgi:hypothetical protein